MSVDNNHPPSRNPQTAKRRPLRAVSRFLMRLTLYGIVLSLLLLAGAGYYAVSYLEKIARATPGVEALLDARSAQPSILLSANGTHLATFGRGQQEQVSLDKISPHAIRALIATEDHRFYEHRGIDLTRTLSAVWQTLNGDAQGGSTITQQLVRNMFPEEIGRARTIDRKIKEIVTALKVEKAYTKDQILESYLNTVPFLYNVIGIEMAARTYYDKPAASLDVLESATLIGMLKGTSYYNPVLNPERARKRRNVVLAQMVKRGMLPADAYASLRDQPLQVTLTRQPDPLGHIAPHFAGHVRRQLIAWADANDYNLFTDGLIIHSTLDDRLQEAATAAVERQAQVLQDIADVEWGRSTDRVASHTPDDYAAMRRKIEPFRHFWNERPDLLDAFVRETPEYRKAVAGGKSEHAALAALKASTEFMTRLRDYKTRLEAGFVALDPLTGEVKAWVGSRNFQRDQFDHVAQAERQPGSTFKPLVYGAALEMGFEPERVYPDGQVEIRTDDGSIWRPTDMSGFSGRMMSMRDGLIYSKNTITAQVMQDVGLQHVIDLARAAGVKNSRLDPVPSLSLGTSPVTLLEMVSAYSTIARIGEYREPVLVRGITDRDGNVLAGFGGGAERVMEKETAIELIDMMRGVVRRGTGTDVRNRFNISADIAGKTGTTQNNTDGWFILMHPRMVAGAWVGFNDSRVAMRSDHWGQGGHNAILLVGDFFRGVTKAKLIDVKAKFPQPKRPPPLIVTAPADELPELPPGYGIITRSDSDSAIVIAPDGVPGIDTGPAAAPTADELERFLTGLAPDPSAGTRAESSGDGGSQGARGSGASGIERQHDVQ